MGRYSVRCEESHLIVSHDQVQLWEGKKIFLWNSLANL